MLIFLLSSTNPRGASKIRITFSSNPHSTRHIHELEDELFRAKMVEQTHVWIQGRVFEWSGHDWETVQVTPPYWEDDLPSWYNIFTFWTPVKTFDRPVVTCYSADFIPLIFGNIFTIRITSPSSPTSCPPPGQCFCAFLRPQPSYKATQSLTANVSKSLTIDPYRRWFMVFWV